MWSTLSFTGVELDILEHSCHALLAIYFELDGKDAGV